MPIATGQYTIVDFNDIDISLTEPTNPTEDQIWLDTSVTPNTFYRYQGEMWVYIGTDLSDITTTIDDLGGEVRSELDDLQSEVDELQSQVGDLEESKADVSVMAELREAHERLQQLVGEYDGTIPEDYQALIERVAGIDAELNDNKVKFNFINNSLNVGEEGVFFGDTINHIGIWISGNEVSFINGLDDDGVDGEGNPKFKLRRMGTFTPSFLDIASGIFTTDLQIGEHKARTIAGGITVFDWVGE